MNAATNEIQEVTRLVTAHRARDGRSRKPGMAAELIRFLQLSQTAALDD